MSQLKIEIPDELAKRLALLAAEQNKSVEQVAIEQLASVLESPREEVTERYDRFFIESGLFVEATEEEKKRYSPASEERLKELAAKLGAAGPLSEVIIEERGRS